MATPAEEAHPSPWETQTEPGMDSQEVLPEEWSYLPVGMGGWGSSTTPGGVVVVVGKRRRGLMDLLVGVEGVEWQPCYPVVVWEGEQHLLP